jgi:hypothetical protein
MSRVRTPGAAALHGYTNGQDFAWSGWRYRIPGGPEGGQYHGFIAPDSSQSWEGGGGGWPGGKSEISDGPQVRPSGISLLPHQGSSRGPWQKEWGGTKFGEGQTHSDYIYRSPGEVRPNPNASGSAHVISAKQTRKSPGYAEAPGNYRTLGAVSIQSGNSVGVPRFPFPIRPGASTGSPRWPVSVWGGGPVIVGPFQPPTTIRTNESGATSSVAQPPPASPMPQNVVMWTSPPVSPAPAPTVAASPADFLPSQGQIVPGITPGTSPIDSMTSSAAAAPAAGSLGDWLQSQTIIPGVANQWIALGAVAAFFMFSGRSGKR